MVDRRVPGYARSSAIAVRPSEVAAAKLQVKRAKQRGETVDPAIEAIANAKPWPSVTEEPEDGVLGAHR